MTQEEFNSLEVDDVVVQTESKMILQITRKISFNSGSSIYYGKILDKGSHLFVTKSHEWHLTRCVEYEFTEPYKRYIKLRGLYE